jgi:hypothetical protein
MTTSLGANKNPELKKDRDTRRIVPLAEAPLELVMVIAPNQTIFTIRASIKRFSHASISTNEPIYATLTTVNSHILASYVDLESMDGPSVDIESFAWIIPKESADWVSTVLVDIGVFCATNIIQ